MEHASIMNKKRRVSDQLLEALIYLCAFLAVGLLLGIIGYVFWRGFRTVNWSFLVTEQSPTKGIMGIAGNIVNTLYIVVLTLLAATPIGVGGAIYLNEYAKPGKFVSLVQFTIETLTGIPSIIFGLFGNVFFGKIFGYSMLTGALTLTIMVLPLIARNTQEALRTVPDSYRSGALGMETQVVHDPDHPSPSAMPGILTGVILAIGRIVGESAALLFTAGSGYYLPKGGMGLFRKLFESGGTMTIELYLQMAKGKYDVAFGIACVLLALVLLLNLLTKYLAGRLNVENRK